MNENMKRKRRSDERREIGEGRGDIFIFNRIEEREEKKRKKTSKEKNERIG